MGGCRRRHIDLVTLGQYFSGDRRYLAERWKGSEFYAGAGHGTAQFTIVTALTVATAGSFSGVTGAMGVGKIGLGSWVAAGALGGAWQGAANEGAAGGNAGAMIGGAVVGGAIGAATTLLFAGAGRALGAIRATGKVACGYECKVHLGKPPGGHGPVEPGIKCVRDLGE